MLEIERATGAPGVASVEEGREKEVARVCRIAGVERGLMNCEMSGNDSNIGRNGAVG